MLLPNAMGLSLVPVEAKRCESASPIQLADVVILLEFSV